MKLIFKFTPILFLIVLGCKIIAITMDGKALQKILLLLILLLLPLWKKKI